MNHGSGTTALRSYFLRTQRLLGILALGALWSLAGCVGDPVPVNHDILKSPRHLRYTLRAEPVSGGLYSQGYRSNYLGFPVFKKVGEKCSFRLYSSHRIDLSFNGIECRIIPRDLPFPTDPDGIVQLVEKHFAATQEELNLDGIEPDIRGQIERGTAAIGMTKEQVLFALGYPSHIDNFVLADGLARDQVLGSNTWIYRHSEPMPVIWVNWYFYKFDEDGKFVQRIPAT